jgi:hypothetical protein
MRVGYDARARICKRLRGPEIDSKESIPPPYMTELIPGLFKRLQIGALLWRVASMEYWNKRRIGQETHAFTVVRIGHTSKTPPLPPPPHDS